MAQSNQALEQTRQAAVVKRTRQALAQIPTHTAYVIVGLLAVIALLFSTFIEYIGTHIGTPDPFESWLVSRSTWVLFFKEVGFALIITLGISLTIEKQAKRRQQTEALGLLRQVKDNVFEAVLGVSMPRPVFDATMSHILSKKFTRSRSRAYYELTIRDLRRKDDSAVRAVILTAHCYFTVENVSSFTEVFPFTIEVEKPPLIDLTTPKEVDVHSVVIGTKTLSREEIDAADQAADDPRLFKKFVYDCSLHAGESVEVSFSFSVVRGLDDAEFWYTLLPNDGMTLQLRMPPEIDRFDVFAIHGQDVTKTHSSGETGYHEWQLKHTVLPYQGIMLWWRYSDSSNARKSEAGSPAAASGDARVPTPPSESVGENTAGTDVVP